MTELEKEAINQGELEMLRVLMESRKKDPTLLKNSLPRLFETSQYCENLTVEGIAGYNGSRGTWTFAAAKSAARIQGQDRTFVTA